MGRMRDPEPSNRCAPEVGDRLDIALHIKFLGAAHEVHASSARAPSPLDPYDATRRLVPSLIRELHKEDTVMRFAQQHVKCWYQTWCFAKFTCGKGWLPSFALKVYSFAALGDTLVKQTQYVTDKPKKKPTARVLTSFTIGMHLIGMEELEICREYINGIVDSYPNLCNFTKLCWMDGDNDWQEKLFELLIQFKWSNNEANIAFRNVVRLVVCTYIMSHTLTICNLDQVTSLEGMHDSANLTEISSQKYPSARLASRQAKHLFARLHDEYTSTAFFTLRQLLDSNRGYSNWIISFVATLCMVMVAEDLQQTVHYVMQTKVKEERLDEGAAQHRATKAALKMEEQAHQIIIAFHSRYNGDLNPIRDADIDWTGQPGFNDTDSVALIKQVSQLIEDNRDYLRTRAGITVHADNPAMYNGRLASHFLETLMEPRNY